MSVQAMSWVIEHSRHKGNAFVVLLMIANHSKEDGTGAWPSIPTLAKKSRIGERTVQRTIARLIRSGELEVAVGHGPKGTNLYTVKMTGGKMTPVVSHDDTGGVSNRADSGVTALSPEPSLKQPSINRPKIFVHPSQEEVRQYCRERNNHVDPEKWLDYYTSNGWKVGRNSMKDWRAAIRTWEKNEHNGAQRERKSATQLREERFDQMAKRAISEVADSENESGSLFERVVRG